MCSFLFDDYKCFDDMPKRRLYCNSEFSPVFTIISITIFFRRHAGVPLENTCEVAL